MLETKNIFQTFLGAAILGDCLGRKTKKKRQIGNFATHAKKILDGFSSLVQ